jgi:predicted nucleic acid-binding protein
MLDTGALIALERGQLSMRRVHDLALATGTTIAVTTPVIAEWWRRGKREKERARLLRAIVIDTLDAHVAKLAGAAIGFVGASVVDALVMAAASVRGDLVYTSDPEDLEVLQDVFSNVEIERV